MQTCSATIMVTDTAMKKAMHAVIMDAAVIVAVTKRSLALPFEGDIMDKKRILIYGDSNTHGFRVDNGLRFGADVRWTGLCQHLLGDDYEILEEGLNGRTTCHDECGMEFRNGLAYIEPCIRTHLPLDMVCVMLGSNDLKRDFQQDAQSIAANAAEVLEKARWVINSKYPDNTCQYVLISPPEIEPDMLCGPFAWDFEGLKTVETSKAFASAFEQQANLHDFLFFDAAKHTKPCKIDGLHLDESGHRSLAEGFVPWLKEHI